MTVLSQTQYEHPMGRAMRSAQQVIVGKSPSAQALKQMVWLAASAQCPLLLIGPAGTGKKEVAGAVHMASSRAAHPYLALNSVTLATQASSAATDLNLLHIADCDGGTVFIDEIHALPNRMQLQILTLIDNGTLQIGAPPTGARLNIRLIAATDQCLISLAGEGGFLPDLYYRLSLMTLPVPSLKQRRADIPMIVEQMLLTIAPRERFSLDVAAMRLLCVQEWKGNLIELRNVVTRTAALHPGKKIGAARMQTLLAMGHPHRIALPDIDTDNDKVMLQPGFDLKVYLDEEEERFLRSALLKAQGVVQLAADLAGIKRTTFVEKMRRHGIKRQDYRNVR
jgi:sigma-54 dependent transcriptional regulator, flagellar regulatory protein